MKKIKATLDSFNTEADKFRDFAVNGRTAIFYYPEGDVGSISLCYSCEQVEGFANMYRLKEDAKRHFAAFLFDMREIGVIANDERIVEMPDIKVYCPELEMEVQVAWQEPEFEFDKFVP